MAKRSWAPWVDGHKQRAANRAFQRVLSERQAQFWADEEVRHQLRLEAHLAASKETTGFWHRIFGGAR